MKFEMNLKIEKPRYFTVSDITYAQVDAWFGHTTRDLKLDLIYPKLKNKKYPCIVWFCGGGWIRLDKSAHFAYLAKLALEGFAVASVEYRTSNEGAYPMPLEDAKAAIRYIKAHADRYNIDENKIGVAGESAGGYLAAMCALDNDKALDVGNYLDCSSEVQACCAFYPPTDVSTFPYESPLTSAASMESLMLGMNVALNKEKAMECCPVSYVTPSAPPFMIFHGTDDSTVSFSQSAELHDLLEKNGCDVTLVAINGAEHADIFFAQEKLWDMVAKFFKDKLYQ